MALLKFIVHFSYRMLALRGAGGEPSRDFGVSAESLLPQDIEFVSVNSHPRKKKRSHIRGVSHPPLQSIFLKNQQGALTSPYL